MLLLKRPLTEESPVALVGVGGRDQWVDGGPTDDFSARHRVNPEDIAAAACRAIAARDGATARSGSTIGHADAILATSEGNQP